MYSDLTWLNPPLSFCEQDGALHVTTRDRTDFWRGTFYGFIRDDGHFLHRAVDGDFTAEVTFEGRYQELYDQAGLMIRLDAENWIKTGIEYTDGVTHVSVVVTRGFSDWSVMPLPWAKDQPLTLRLTRHGEAVRIQFKDQSGAWQMLRLAYLPPTPSAQVGMTCCSPQREGFEAVFRDFRIGAAISRELHDIQPFPTAS